MANEWWTTGRLIIICLTLVACCIIFTWGITKDAEIRAIQKVEHDKERPRKLWEKEPKAE